MPKDKIYKFIEGFLLMAVVLTACSFVAVSAKFIGDLVQNATGADSLTVAILFVFCLVVGCINMGDS